MKTLAFYLDGVRQFSSCPEAKNRKRVHECVAQLAAEETRRSHLTTNWFHQTWKLHCYLIFCLSGSKEEFNITYKLASASFNEDFLWIFKVSFYTSWNFLYLYTYRWYNLYVLVNFWVIKAVPNYCNIRAAFRFELTVDNENLTNHILWDSICILH